MTVSLVHYGMGVVKAVGALIISNSTRGTEVSLADPRHTYSCLGAPVQRVVAEHLPQQQPTNTRQLPDVITSKGATSFKRDSDRCWGCHYVMPLRQSSKIKPCRNLSSREMLFTATAFDHLWCQESFCIIKCVFRSYSVQRICKLIEKTQSA